MEDTNKKRMPKVPKVWHPQQEVILKAWGETCACYRYLHYKAYQKFKKQSMRFTLPIIVISTITGTANFAQETFPLAWQPYVPAGIGALNLIAAIMTTVAQFLKVSELLESHRVSSIHYGKLARSIRLELTLPIHERAHDGTNMVEICRSELDRLIEQSPPIPSDVLNEFEKKVSTSDVSYTTPEIMNVRSIEPYDGHREIELMHKTVEQFKRRVSDAHEEKIPQKAGETVINEIKNLRRQGLVKKHLVAQDEVQLTIDPPEPEHDENQEANENEVIDSAA